MLRWDATRRCLIGSIQRHLLSTQNSFSFPQVESGGRMCKYVDGGSLLGLSAVCRIHVFWTDRYISFPVESYLHSSWECLPPSLVRAPPPNAFHGKIGTKGGDSRCHSRKINAQRRYTTARRHVEKLRVQRTGWNNSDLSLSRGRIRRFRVHNIAQASDDHVGHAVIPQTCVPCKST